LTTLPPESVNITFASSGLLCVSAPTVWKVYVLDVELVPVIVLLCAIVPNVIEFTMNVLYVNVLSQLFCVDVKLSYCSTSAIEFVGFVIETEQNGNGESIIIFDAVAIAFSPIMH
jgi:hypothetical protein